MIRVDIEVIYLPLKDILMNILDTERQFSPNEKTIFLRHPVSVQQTSIKSKVMKGDAFEELEKILNYFKETLGQMISVVNNLGVMSVMRGRFSEGLSHFYRALFCRLQELGTLKSFYQCILLELNISFTSKQMKDHEDSAALLNKAIVVMEKLDQYYRTAD